MFSSLLKVMLVTLPPTFIQRGRDSGFEFCLFWRVGQWGLARSWVTFARRDHPVIADWSMRTWGRWPHLQERIANQVRSPIEARHRETGATRLVGAIITDFSGVGAMFGGTDFLATFSPVAMYGLILTHGLVALKAPLNLPIFPVRFYWSARLANDPGSLWFRNLVLSTCAELNREAEAALSEARLVQPLPGTRPGTFRSLATIGLPR